ncbi:MAG: (Fe-S)-binding protein [Deltaproteobacteria bacterium CG11_big_fil_rev_8_21_14_0_20_49_13]|nr:MAG: (Fe-S)-binding protein [Deltaproteobacteria bacterium CG11_big_fil_rev_8_21_14_0_20_49_13]
MIDQRVLVKLIDRLNSYPIGLPDAPEIREFLSIFLTPDEALLASLFPMKEATTREMAKRAMWGLQKTEATLEKMADKGAVIDFKLDEGHHYWFLTPSIIGFIEFSLMKTHNELPMKKMAELLHAYEHEHLWKEVFGSQTQMTRALIEHDVPISSEVMTYAQVTEVIKAAGGGGVQTCFCRHQAHLLGEPCKRAGFEGTCISLGKASDFTIRRGFARKASAEELLALVKELGKKGLIHVTDNIRNTPSFVCNCCGCCCGLLTGITEKKIPHAVSPTPFILKVNEDNCNGCGACAKMCQISAVKMEGKKARVDVKNCLGCGSCIKFCKKEALSLVERKKRPKLPGNVSVRFLKMAFEKGRLLKLFPDMLTSRMAKYF